MLKDRDIVYVANNWRSENKTSAHHVAEELARHNQLLYVEAAGQRAMRASGRDMGKAARILSKVWAKPTKISERMHLCAPLILPFHGVPGMAWVNRLLLKVQIRRAVRHVGFKRPLIWIAVPHFSAVMDAVASVGVVYYCVDQYAAQPGSNKAHIQRHEDAILERANIVFAVSEELVERKKAMNANTFFSPHGVDFDHFAKARLDDTKLPADIAGIKHPILGFFGLLAEWVDFELLRHVAVSLPEASVVLIGRTSQDETPLKGLSNIHLLGQKSYGELPAYLKAMDVCMLPYKMNEQVINSNPKKLREYLAGGKPVVSVPVREVKRYGNLVAVADDYDQFVDQIRNALQGEDAAAAENRVSAMRSESWEQRVSEVGDRVEAHINGSM